MSDGYFHPCGIELLFIRKMLKRLTISSYCHLVLLCIAGCPLWMEKLELLEKLENEPSFRVLLEKLENHRFFPALARKTGILFFCQIISSGIIKWKMILLRNRIKEQKIFQYLVRQALFIKSTQDWNLSICFARMFDGSLPSGGGLPEDIEFILIIPIYWKF